MKVYDMIVIGYQQLKSKKTGKEFTLIYLESVDELEGERSSGKMCAQVFQDIPVEVGKVVQCVQNGSFWNILDLGDDF